MWRSEQFEGMSVDGRVVRSISRYWRASAADVWKEIRRSYFEDEEYLGQRDCVAGYLYTRDNVQLRRMCGGPDAYGNDARVLLTWRDEAVVLELA